MHSILRWCRMSQRVAVILLALNMLTVMRSAGQAAPSTCLSATVPGDCELRAGIQAWRDGQAAEAVRHFRQALVFDPALTRAHLCLGAAFAHQVITGVETAEMLGFERQATAEFSFVLKQAGSDPADRTNALRNLGQMSFNRKKFAEAKGYFKRVIELEPGAADATYQIAVIDWTEVYAERMKVYGTLHLQPDKPLTNTAACEKLAGEYWATVQESMQMLTRTLQVRPADSDAMAYMNLVYRERAALECNDAAARAADTEAADRWVDAAITTKKKLRQRQPNAPPPQ